MPAAEPHPNASPVNSTTARVAALDALRGLAILMMALSGWVPFGQTADDGPSGALPAWMYHAQQPPPDHAFDPTLPGLTWVDLVFPFFLFSMGAAMPLSMGRKLDRLDAAGRAASSARARIVGGILWRGALLLFFGVFIQHMNPWLNPVWAGWPAIGLTGDSAHWLTALLGMLLLTVVFARVPRHCPPWAAPLTTIIGLLLAAGFLATIRFPDDAGFSPFRLDIIIVLLAHVAVAGALLWWASRDNWLLRFAFVFAVAAIVIAAEAPGWVRQVWHFWPRPMLDTDAAPATIAWLGWFKPPLILVGYCKYLLVVLPGTFVGDVLAGRAPTNFKRPNADHPPQRAAQAAAGLLAAVLVTLVTTGLQARWLPATTLIAFGVLTLAGITLRAAPTAVTAIQRQLFFWGATWLVIGLLFEPFEGGVKKDNPTMSYYFITSGLAVFTLIMFDALRTAWGHGPFQRLLEANGRNPLLAYAGIRGLVPPLMGLTGAYAWLNATDLTPWTRAAIAALQVLLLAGIVAFLTRRSITLRA